MPVREIIGKGLGFGIVSLSCILGGVLVFYGPHAYNDYFNVPLAIVRRLMTATSWPKLQTIIARPNCAADPALTGSATRLPPRLRLGVAVAATAAPGLRAVATLMPKPERKRTRQASSAATMIVRWGLPPPPPTLLSVPPPAPPVLASPRPVILISSEY